MFDILNYITTLDAAIITAHLIICIAIGYYHSRYIKTTEDFYSIPYKRTLPAVLLCTIFATAVGGGTVFGCVDELYNNSSALFFIITQPIYWLVTSKVVTTGIHKFKDCQSIAGMMHKLFGKFGKIITLFNVLVDCIGTTSIQIFSFAAICQYFFNVDFMYGIAFAIIVINLYSTLGGFRGIISIDIFQFLIFFAIIPFSFVMTINDSNFSGYFIDSLPSSSFKMELTLPIAIGLVTVSLLPEISAPFTQRYLNIGP